MNSKVLSKPSFVSKKCQPFPKKSSESIDPKPLEPVQPVQSVQPVQAVHSYGSSIYQCLPFQTLPPQPNIFVPQFHSTSPLFYHPQQNPINQPPLNYPNLQNYLHPFSQTTPNTIPKPPSNAPKAEQIRNFKKWTSEVRNRASGLEFYFDSKGCIFLNDNIKLTIKQGRCFQEESRPHLKFILILTNQTSSPLTSLSASLSNSSTNYTLLANTKKLTTTLNPNDSQSISFAIFPTTLPIKSIKFKLNLFLCIFPFPLSLNIASIY